MLFQINLGKSRRKRLLFRKCQEEIKEKGDKYRKCQEEIRKKGDNLDKNMEEKGKDLVVQNKRD